MKRYHCNLFITSIVGDRPNAPPPRESQSMMYKRKRKSNFDQLFACI